MSKAQVADRVQDSSSAASAGHPKPAEQQNRNFDSSWSHVAVFSPIKSGGLVDEVSRRIESAIETGMLLPGQRLPSESELAEALGVSAVTAREGLSRLRARGLIVTTRGRTGGSFIADDVRASTERTASARLKRMTRRQVVDLGLHYQALAAFTARLAAQRASVMDAQTLEGFVDPGTADANHWRLLAGEFALELGAASRSSRLVREILELHTEIGYLMILPYGDPEFRAASVAARARVVEAIKKHDADAAERAMAEQAKAVTDWLLSEHDRLLISAATPLGGYAR